MGSIKFKTPPETTPIDPYPHAREDAAMWARLAKVYKSDPK